MAHGKVFNAYVRSTMLHGSETWAPSVPDLQRLHRNDIAMVRWIHGVKVHSDALHARLGIQEVTEALYTRCLRWYGHVMRSSSCTNTVIGLNIPGLRGRGRPRKTWLDRVKADKRT